MNTTKQLPIVKTIEIYRGDAWTRGLRLLGKNATTGESYLIDTADFTARMQVRESYDSTVILTAAVCVVGISGTGANQRNLTVSIPAHVTATYPAGATWKYDLELTDPSGRPRTLLRGDFNVQGDVTR